MKKLRRFLRILLILLPFSILGICYADDHGGGVSDVHVYNHGGGTAGGTDWTEHGGGLSTDDYDPAWVSSMREDVDSFEPDFSISAKKFLLWWDYFHKYGTTDSIPGDEFTSDTWQIPYEFRITVQYLYSYTNYEGSYWTNYANIIVDPTIDNSVSGTDPWGTYYTLDYSNGKLTYSFDFSNLVSDITFENDIRVQTYAYFNGYPGIMRVVSPSPVGTFLTAGSNCYITDGNTVNIDTNPVMFYAHVGNNSYIQYFWSDYIYGGVTAPETPILTYPTDTTNNYYDQEKNYYYYMQNAVDLIEDSASVSDFEFEYDWGLLSLPAGLIAGTLESLGEYSSVCSFSFNGIDFTLIGGEILSIPPMAFEFDADDYLWLLPFRYLIALSLLFVLSKQAWSLFSNIINGGDTIE